MGCLASRSDRNAGWGLLRTCTSTSYTLVIPTLAQRAFAEPCPYTTAAECHACTTRSTLHLGCCNTP